MFQDFNDFIVWERASRDTIDVKVCYLDLAGDVVAGLFLSQLVYWYLPNSKGQSKLRIYKDKEYWIAKTHNEWYEEIRLTQKQVRRSLEVLKSKGIVETRIYKYNGTPTTHIRIIKDTFLKKLKEVLGLSNPPDPDNTGNAPEGNSENTGDNLDLSGSAPEGKWKCPRGQMNYAQRDKSITETTTEITNKDNKDQSVSHKKNKDSGQREPTGKKTDKTGYNSQFSELVKEQIQYDSFSPEDQNILEAALTGLMLGDLDKKKPRSIVLSLLEKLDYWSVERALESYRKCGAERIVKPLAYFQTCLLNAGAEEGLELSKFKHQMQWGRKLGP